MRLSGNGDYATAANDNSSTSDGTNDVRGTTSGDSSQSAESSQRGSQESRSWGYTGHAPQLIAKWRETFTNVDMMVITELQELFMQVRSSNDSLTGRRATYGLWY